MTDLLELNIENFRPYYRENSFQFSTDPKKNFNVIVGGSGSGKTSIMDAISWCMYGVEQHKTGKEDRNVLRIVNDQMRNETEIGDTITISVEMIFGEDGQPEYFFLRSMAVRKNAENSVELIPGSSKFSVKIRDERNNTSDYPYPDNATNWIFPQRIQHLFKFDGEQLKNFFERDNSNKTKQAIKDITQINKLDAAHERIQSVLKSYKPKRSKSRDLEDLESLKKSENDKLKQLDGDLDKKQQEYAQVDRDLTEIEGALKDYGNRDIEKLMDDEKAVEEERQKIDKRIKEIQVDKITHILQSHPTIFCRQALVDADAKIDEKYRSGELPSDIKESFVKRLLERNQCICHTALEEGSEARGYVEAYLELAPLSKYEDKIRHGQIDIRKRLNEIDVFREKRRDFERQLAEAQERLRDTNQELLRLQSALKDVKQDKVRSQLSRRVALKNALSVVSREIGNIEGKKERAREDIERIDKEISRITKGQIDNDETREKYEIGEKIVAFIKDLEENLLKELKSDIELHTNKIFKQCLIEPRASRVVISDNYEVKVLDKTGANLYSELSEAQKEVLAASFIMALRKDSGFDSPIIFDFPFGRMDNPLTAKTIEALHTVLDGVQVIFILIKEKEFRDFERHLMRPYIGSEYHIEKSEDKLLSEVSRVE